mmetsp:Transcript_1750/g.5532  ORF Transcript_1750/g.5532 Transcript_1750/m.5532 type:complete len:387 (-) Transcript_1750:218-1378(-)
MGFGWPFSTVFQRHPATDQRLPLHGHHLGPLLHERALEGSLGLDQRHDQSHLLVLHCGCCGCGDVLAGAAEPPGGHGPAGLPHQPRHAGLLLLRPLLPLGRLRAGGAGSGPAADAGRQGLSHLARCNADDGQEPRLGHRGHRGARLRGAQGREGLPRRDRLQRRRGACDVCHLHAVRACGHAGRQLWPLRAAGSSLAACGFCPAGCRGQPALSRDNPVVYGKQGAPGPGARGAAGRARRRDPVRGRGGVGPRGGLVARAPAPGAAARLRGGHVRRRPRRGPAGAPRGGPDVVDAGPGPALLHPGGRLPGAAGPLGGAARRGLPGGAAAAGHRPREHGRGRPRQLPLPRSEGQPDRDLLHVAHPGLAGGRDIGPCAGGPGSLPRLGQ